MQHKRWVEICVGVLMMLGFLALLFLALKVSGLTAYTGGTYYAVTAEFDNIGDLKVRSPVTMAGVRIGQVANIQLDPKTYRAEVTLDIQNQDNMIPVDSSASILTQGLLGSNYISLSPGFEKTFLRSGGRIETTNSALILENLIGQLIFSMKDKDEDKDK